VTDQIECPSCGEPLVPTATSCPVCLRSRTAREITKALRDQRPSAKIKKTLTGASLWRTLLGLAVLGGGYYAHTHNLLPSGESGARAQRILMGKRAAKRDINMANANPEALEAARQEAKIMQERETAAQKVASIGSQQAIAQKIIDEHRQEAEEQLAKDQDTWHIFGRVYELTTLVPISEVRITFDGPDGPKRVRTDDRGEYKVTLPALKSGGYRIRARHRRYTAKYLDEMSPPYHTQSLKRRQDELELMQTATVLHVPISLAEDETERRHNLILAR
jgi:hypothetical protein